MSHASIFTQAVYMTIVAFTTRDENSRYNIKPMTDARETRTKQNTIYLMREISCCKSVWDTYKFLARVSRTCVMDLTNDCVRIYWRFTMTIISRKLLLLIMHQFSVFNAQQNVINRDVKQSSNIRTSVLKFELCTFSIRISHYWVITIKNGAVLLMFLTSW